MVPTRELSCTCPNEVETCAVRQRMGFLFLGAVYRRSHTADCLLMLQGIPQMLMLQFPGPKAVMLTAVVRIALNIVASVFWSVHPVACHWNHAIESSYFTLICRLPAARKLSTQPLNCQNHVQPQPASLYPSFHSLLLQAGGIVRYSKFTDSSKALIISID